MSFAIPIFNSMHQDFRRMSGLKIVKPDNLKAGHTLKNAKDGRLVDNAFRDLLIATFAALKAQRQVGSFYPERLIVEGLQPFLYSFLIFKNHHAIRMPDWSVQMQIWLSLRYRQ